MATAQPSRQRLYVDANTAINAVIEEVSFKNFPRTEMEKQAVQKNTSAIKRRGLLGGFAGVWKLSGSKRSFVAAMMTAVGTFAGFATAVSSCKDKLFLEILTLPDEGSPFAKQARYVLEKRMPNNLFYLEIKQRMGKEINMDDVVEAKFEKPQPSPPVQKPSLSASTSTTGFSYRITSSSELQRTPGMRQYDHKSAARVPRKPLEPLAQAQEEDLVSSSSIFSFFDQSTSQHMTLQSNLSASRQRNNGEFLTNDEEAYFFGLPYEVSGDNEDCSAPRNWTTWEEIRRRNGIL